MRELAVGVNEAGQRLDKLLKKYMREANTGFIYKMLRKKNIVLNDKKATGGELLKQGDAVKLYLSEETLNKMTGEDSKAYVKVVPGYAQCEAGDIDKKRELSCGFSGGLFKSLESEFRRSIVYEDEHLLLLNKPSGWLSQGDGTKAPSVNELCLDYLMSEAKLDREQLKSFKPGIVNRLDRNTSGLILFGKSLPALQELAGELRDRSLKKYYLAVVAGEVRGSAKIHGYLKRIEKERRVKIRNEKFADSSEIHTEYETVASFRGRNESESFTVLRVHLITGKTHQIRAHLASIGHPILGDGKYADKEINSYWKKSKGVSSQLLHAHELIFPDIGEMGSATLEYLAGRSFRAMPPKEFEGFLQGASQLIRS